MVASARWQVQTLHLPPGGGKSQPGKARVSGGQLARGMDWICMWLVNEVVSALGGQTDVWGFSKDSDSQGPNFSRPV